MLDLAIVFALVLLNGCFALSELAIVSARRPRLRAMAEDGRAGARAALALAEDPGKFLSTVQIGITLVGVVAGAFSGATLGGALGRWLAGLGVPTAVADPVGFGAVIALVTYLSIVVGELVPKRFALRRPEALACLVAPPMTIVARVGAPAVWLLDASTNLIFRLLGQTDDPEEKVTQDDVRTLIAEAERHGSIESSEQRMIQGVLRLGSRPVRAVMTPRGEVDWLDLRAGQAGWREMALTARHSLLPVGDGSIDAVLGVVRVRDLLAALARDETLDPRGLMRPAPVVPDTAEALAVLGVLRESKVPMALVHDEYGHLEGLVTPTDLTGTIIGDFGAEAEEAHEPAVQRDDGSWLLAGAMPLDEAAEILGIKLPEPRSYQTIGGLVLHLMGRIPEADARADGLGWRWEVVDMDGRRIDKVLVHPKAPGVAALRRPGGGALER
ncbi:MAG: hemolysin family protein [Acetobacteraceae bacterium]|nr:hemolysin family protein [Acetobacteraceae bacterium]